MAEHPDGPEHRLTDDVLVVVGLLLVLGVIATIEWRLSVALVGVCLVVAGARR